MLKIVHPQVQRQNILFKIVANFKKTGLTKVDNILVN